MDAHWVEILDCKIVSDEETRKAWDQLKPVIASGKVATRKDAYLSFSRLLKVSNGIGSDEKIRKLWADFLAQGQLSIEGSDQQYDFSPILKLFREGKKSFAIQWFQMDPNEESIHHTAQIIHSIAQESIGIAPNITLMEKLLKAPFVFTLVAKTEGVSIAAEVDAAIDGMVPTADGGDGGTESSGGCAVGAASGRSDGTFLWLALGLLWTRRRKVMRPS